MDFLTANIIQQNLETTAHEMGVTMGRVARSPIFNEAHDLAVGIFEFDRHAEEARLVAAANGQTILMAAIVSSVQEAVKYFRHDLHEGDVIVINDSFYGGAHLSDWTVLIPVFRGNVPVAIPAVRAHMGDTGAPAPGGYNIESEEIWQDGVRIPPLKIYADGKKKRDVFQWLLTNNRLTHWLEGDLGGMIAACRIADRRIHSLIDQYGLEVFQEAVAWNIGHTEKCLRDMFSAWPDGEYEGESILEQDFKTGQEVKVKATLKVSGSNLKIDFTGSDPEAPGFINSPIANTLSWVFVALTTVSDVSAIPLNHGIWQAIEVIAPEHTVVNAQYPAATGFCTSVVGTHVAESLIKSFEKIVPDRVGHNYIKVPFVLSSGIDPRSGNIYVSLNFHGHTGGGAATRYVDGWGLYPPCQAAGLIPSAEMVEIQYPCRILEHEFIIDSAGPGKWRGLPSIRTRTQYLDHVSHHQVLVWGDKYPLPGLAGGKDAPWGNSAILNHGSPQAVQYSAALDITMPPDGIVCQLNGGGGGWGDPYERDETLVQKDVSNGLVSIAGALKDYGVKLDPATYDIEYEETKSIRKIQLRDQ